MVEEYTEKHDEDGHKILIPHKSGSVAVILKEPTQAWKDKQPNYPPIEKGRSLLEEFDTLKNELKAKGVVD